QHAQKHDGGDREVKQAGEHGGGGHDEAREVHLGDELLVLYEAVCSERDGRGEERPGNESAEEEDWIGRAAGWDAGQAPEEDTEDDHGRERLEHRPRRSQRRLLIADLDVPPHQEVEELTVLPELSDPQSSPAA